MKFIVCEGAPQLLIVFMTFRSVTPCHLASVVILRIPLDLIFLHREHIETIRPFSSIVPLTILSCLFSLLYLLSLLLSSKGNTFFDIGVCSLLPHIIHIRFLISLDLS